MCEGQARRKDGKPDVGQAMDAHHAWGILTSTSKSQVSGLAMTVDGGRQWGVVSAPQP